VRAVGDAAAAHRLALPWGFRAGVVKVVVGRLTGIETVLLDLDGTLYVGSQVVPGAPEAVRWLRDQGLTVRFCTNTDSIPRPPWPTGWPGAASSGSSARVLGKPSPEFFTAPLDALGRGH
jgi:Haloacid dehalogenase-like hydrolase